MVKTKDDAARERRRAAIHARILARREARAKMKQEARTPSLSEWLGTIVRKGQGWTR